MQSKIPEGETLSREYLVNERTLLSWIRTGINAIGVGILLDTVARALSVLSPGAFGDWPVADSRQEESALFGLILVVFGGLIELAAVVRFVQYSYSIGRGQFTPAWLVYLLVALSLALLGVAYIIYAVVV